MTEYRKVRPRGRWWLLSALLLVVLVAGAAYFLVRPPHARARAGSDEGGGAASTSEPHVEVVKPTRGVIERKTEQPGTVMAFESADLYSEVTGFLKTQKVDIGSPVKKGEILATIDVPDLDAQVKEQQANLDYANAHVDLLKSKVKSAEADRDAAKAAVTEAQANIGSARATLNFRQKQLIRFRQLYEEKSIDRRAVDEKEEERNAAEEALNATKAARIRADAQFEAAGAKVDEANAAVKDGTVKVAVAQEALHRAQVEVAFGKIVSPYTWVVSRRTFFPGDFIRGGEKGGAQHPLLTVQRTDKMRVVVQIPDRDVPYVQVGDKAVIHLDALPTQTFEGSVARLAESEDPETRTMRCEIDVENPKNRMRQGMYGLVTITLERESDAVTIPSSCLVGKVQNGKADVFVVRDGKAHLTPIKVGIDNGIQVQIAGGLKGNEDVVVNGGGLNDGDAVIPVPAKQAVARSEQP